MTYELTRWVYSAAELETRLQESGGELTPQLEEWIAMMEVRLPAAVDNAKLFLDRLETVEKEWRERAAEVTRVARALSNAREKVKDRVKATMEANGPKELLGNQYRLTLSDAKPALEIDETLIPMEYKKAEVEWVVDKEKIRSVLDAGERVAGASLRAVKTLRSYFKK